MLQCHFALHYQLVGSSIVSEKDVKKVSSEMQYNQSVIYMMTVRDSMAKTKVYYRKDVTLLWAIVRK
jgi:hypothetical protein